MTLGATWILTAMSTRMIGFLNDFGIERKTVSVLVNCRVSPERERFEREPVQLRGYRFKRLVIIGDEADIQNGKYRAEVTPQAVFGSLDAWQVRFDVPYVQGVTPEAAARQIERWAHYFFREYLKSAEEIFCACKDA